MRFPRYHIADIALVSSRGSETGGYMIVPLIPTNDTQTEVFPIYSRKKMDTTEANLPKVLNEVIRLTASGSGFDKLYDSAVLNKLPRRSNFQSTMSRRRPQVLSNLSGVIDCKPCPSFAKLTLDAGDCCSVSERKAVSKKDADFKHNFKVDCQSCLTPIDADFKYCPSCGVLRRNLSSVSTGETSSRQSTPKSSKLRTKCDNCSHFVNKYNMKFHIATCQGKRQGKVPTLPHKEKPVVTPFQEQKDESIDQEELKALKQLPSSSSSSDPIKGSGTYNVDDALRDKMPLEKEQGPLFECPSCFRTFLARSLAIHRRSCGHTLNFQRRPLKDEDNLKPALTIARSRKHSKKGRWRP